MSILQTVLGNILLLITAGLALWRPAPPPEPPPGFPQKQLVNATTSAVLDMPETPPVPWGRTEKIGDHLYRTYVGADPVMGTPDEILAALNKYRGDHGSGRLASDPKLCELADARAKDQQKGGGLDSHKGLQDYLAEKSHWQELGVIAVGENASSGYVLSAVHLIEWVFNADEEHRDNQLNPHWTYACAGIAGSTVDIIFGKK